MESQVRIFPGEGEEIQRVHVVRLEDWSELEFLRPQGSETAFDCFYRIYQQFLVPTQPWAFGNLVMFRLPAGFQLPQVITRRYADRVKDPLTVAALALRQGVTIRGETVRFQDAATRRLWNMLLDADCLRVMGGKLPITSILPVGDQAGFLTAAEPEAKLKANASFFIMDPLDCATAYDHIGDAFGLQVKDGVVEHPPLFDREALLVHRDGKVKIENPKLEQLQVKIGETVFTHGENARFYARPDWARTPPVKKALVIVGRQVVAVCGGSTPVPASGFVLCPKEACAVSPGDAVTYQGMEEIRFGIQVGNSILRDGIKTESWRSKFYNVRNLQPIAYPPSLYPLDFENAKAARMALGADKDGKPMLLWAEGMAKLGHIPGRDSCGASMADMVHICQAVGMHNAIHLDGGGSAQILLDNQRSLCISDRTPDFAESERPVPLGLWIR